MRSGPIAGRLLNVLLTQSQFLDQCVVALDIFLLEIGEQIATLVDHHKQAATRMVIFVMTFEVFSQVADTLGEDRNLHFRTARIAFGLGVVLDNLLFLLG